MKKPPYNGLVYLTITPIWWGKISSDQLNASILMGKQLGFVIYWGGGLVLMHLTFQRTTAIIASRNTQRLMLSTGDCCHGTFFLGCALLNKGGGLPMSYEHPLKQRKCNAVAHVSFLRSFSSTMTPSAIDYSWISASLWTEYLLVLLLLHLIKKIRQTSSLFFPIAA